MLDLRDVNNMNVRELMDLLSQYSAGMRVVADGYESGYQEALISVPKIRLNGGKEWRDGRHGDTCDELSKDGSSANVLAIHRSSRYESIARN